MISCEPGQVFTVTERTRFCWYNRERVLLATAVVEAGHTVVAGNGVGGSRFFDSEPV